MTNDNDARGALTAERLRSLFSYDPETGLFTRLSLNGSKQRSPIRGAKSYQGYLMATIDDRSYRMHRLAWLYVHGTWPTGDIDHINGVKTDNRIANLRDVCRSMNNENRRAPSSRSSTGFLGVRISSATIKNKYYAEITVRGKRKHLGCFATPEEAYAVYLEAKRQLHEGCTL